ncbi:hypothetical protein JOL62DRAFT_292766 [Phyllosticta paracitricarpa]|uniref:Secreted protein n=1 Tax=Phyllosticta paracitricarpa TaxID=2016321 RepID=A0ABR1NJ55_9PEZI
MSLPSPPFLFFFFFFFLDILSALSALICSQQTQLCSNSTVRCGAVRCGAAGNKDGEREKEQTKQRKRGEKK